MGIPNRPVTVRWSDAHLAILRRIGESFDPPSIEHTFILHTAVSGLWAYLTTGKMPRWMRELKSILGNSGVTVCTESAGEQECLPVEGARRALLGTSGAAKRPPRRYYERLRKKQWAVSLDGREPVIVRHLFVREVEAQSETARQATEIAR